MDLTAIFNVVVAVVIVGGVLYLLNLAPFDATIKRAGQVIIIVIALLWAIRWLVGLAH